MIELIRNRCWER